MNTYDYVMLGSASVLALGGVIFQVVVLARARRRADGTPLLDVVKDAAFTALVPIIPAVGLVLWWMWQGR